MPETEFRSLSTAALAQLQEVAVHSRSGCTQYTFERLAGSDFICEQQELFPGDMVYMPKGVIHYAIAGDEGSVHATFSLPHDEHTWLDLIAASCSGSASDSQCHTLLTYISAAADTPYGVGWQRLVSTSDVTDARSHVTELLVATQRHWFNRTQQLLLQHTSNARADPFHIPSAMMQDLAWKVASSIVTMPSENMLARERRRKISFSCDCDADCGCNSKWYLS
jgi:hypothetical protein